MKIFPLALTMIAILPLALTANVQGPGASQGTGEGTSHDAAAVSENSGMDEG